MNKEEIIVLLQEISTNIGLSYSGDRTISYSEKECILDYIDNLQQDLEKANKVIDGIEKLLENILQDTKKPSVLYSSDKMAIRISIEHIKDKIKELKGDGKEW